MRCYPVLRVGAFARQTLSAHATAHVQGSTSRGIFLLFPDRKVVFISYQPFAGPLNLNLAKKHSAILPVRSGEAAQITKMEIVLGEAGLRFDLAPAQDWQSPPAPPLASHWRVAMESLARQAYASRPNEGWAPLLPRLLGWDEPPTPLPAELEAPLAHLLASREALRAGHDRAAAERLQSLIGLGHGLTPSGDDCLAGLLLMRHRAGWSRPGSDALTETLVKAAFEHSTALSANLLEAAAAGEAEERLLRACDAILSGAESFRALGGLLDYGSSSGLDALVGMCLF